MANFLIANKSLRLGTLLKVTALVYLLAGLPSVYAVTVVANRSPAAGGSVRLENTEPTWPQVKTVPPGVIATITGAVNDVVLIEATPNPGYTFVRWDGSPPAGQILNPSILHLMDVNRTLTAIFEAQQGLTISLSILPPLYAGLEGVGSITQVTVSVNGGPPTNYNPTATYLSNDVITITAYPNLIAPRSFIFEWGGNIPQTLEDANRPHPASFSFVMGATSREITLLASREYHPNEGVGDLDLDGLPDIWELRYGLDPKDATAANGPDGNAPGDLSMPTAWPYNNFPAGFYPGAVSGLNTNWPYRFHINGSRPLNYYVGSQPFNNRLRARGFDGWFGLNPLTGRNDDPHAAPISPGVDPRLLSTAGDGIPDGWKYWFYGSATNDSSMVGVALGIYTDPNLPAPVTTVPNNPIVATFNTSMGVDPAVDLDNDCVGYADEYLHGSDPVHWDTDADAMSDGWEARKLLNPISPGDAIGSSGDYMAYYTDAGVQYRHDQVYRDIGFDPRTAWGGQYLSRGANRSLTAQLNTIPFTHLEKYKASVYLAALASNVLNCGNFDTYALSVTNIDSDQDGIFDGWELYAGFDHKCNPTRRGLNPMDPGDALADVSRTTLCGARGSGINNRQKFSAFDIDLIRGTPWPNGYSHFDPAWMNKVWPCDPWSNDTDGDGLSDGAEGGWQVGDFQGNGTDASLVVLKYAGGVTNWNGSCYVGGGLNPTTVDTDRDMLPDHWESTQLSTSFDVADVEARDGMDPTTTDADRDYDSDGLFNYQEYLVGAVHHWRYRPDVPLISDGLPPGLPLGSHDPMYFFTGVPFAWDWHVNASAGVPFYYIQHINNRYNSGLVRDPDSDRDGMDDYWEIYHGLNPVFGTYDRFVSMYANALVSASTPPWFDIRIAPYAAGYPTSDSDQDGLPNLGESLQPNDGVPFYYHTDPSPLWITDTSYQRSWVNLYYAWNPAWRFYFNGAALSGNRPNPTYMFSFDVTEGFDTDGDFIGDRAELVHEPVVSPGISDPLSVESPARRSALFLEGDSAARTRAAFLHEYFNLENFTVEAWVKPVNPASGQTQVIVERPIYVSNGNIMGAPAGIRYNFRLALDAAGVPYVAYNGAGFDALYVEAKGPSQIALKPDLWTHLAGVYDGAAKQLRLYVNGQLRRTVGSAERPFNGWFTGSPAFINQGPMVVGASDANPDGWVSGMPIWVGEFAGTVSSQPILRNYFHGWVDEVRVWDGSQSSASIETNMGSTLTMSDVNVSYQASSNGAPALMYLYTFDSLHDPVTEGVAPSGFNLLNGRPNDGTYPSVPWWNTSSNRSSVYTDHQYVPWIPNIAARLPLDPPADSPFNGQYVVATAGQTNVVTTPTTSVVNGVTNIVNVTVTNVTPAVYTFNDYPNSANPYNMAYYHAGHALLERNPDLWLHTDDSLVFTLREANLFNDLIPLGRARGDVSVELWDRLGPGGKVEEGSEVDANSDGIPDWWQILNFPSFDATLVCSNIDSSVICSDAYAWCPCSDPDGDGVNNYYEWLGGLDPSSAYSDSSVPGEDAIPDGLRDSDHDGLNVIQEQAVQTDPTRADTDDDGLLDGDEVQRGTEPTFSGDPLITRAAKFAGNQALYVVNSYDEIKVDRVVEAWVKPDAANSSAVLLFQRDLETVYDGERTYALGLSNGVPYFTYQVKQIDGATSTVWSAIATNLNSTFALTTNWIHLAGVVDSAGRQLRVYQDGKRVAFSYAVPPPRVRSSGRVDLSIGGLYTNSGSVLNGFVGQLDAVRAWDYFRSGLEIQNNRDVLYPEFDGRIPDAVRAPIHLFNFDSGGSNAQNSVHLMDWQTDWQYASVAKGPGSNVFSDSTLSVTNDWPPRILNSDDDGMSDYDERTQGWEVYRSEIPLEYRALDFDGTPDSLVEVDELIDNNNSAIYALTNWTLEAWVRPNAIANGHASIIRRVVDATERVTFELGLFGNVGEGTLQPYARFTRADSGYDYFTLMESNTVAVGSDPESWTHLAATYSNATFNLFVNGVKVRTTGLPVGAVPFIGTLGKVYLGATNYDGQVQDVRIWSSPRAESDIANEYKHLLLFVGEGIDQSYQGTNSTHLSRLTDAREDGLAYSFTNTHQTHRFGLAAWVRVNPGARGGIVAERKRENTDAGGQTTFLTNHSLRISALGNPQVAWQGLLYGTFTPSPIEVERSVSSEVDIRDGKWHHIAALGDGREVTLYLDGVQDRTKAVYYPDLPRARTDGSIETSYATYMPSHTELRIADRGFDGVVDEVMFWNENPTEAELQRYMHNGLDIADMEIGLSKIIPLPDGVLDLTSTNYYQRLVSYVTFDGISSNDIPYISDKANENRSYRIVPMPSTNGSELVRNSRPDGLVPDAIARWRTELRGYYPGSDGGMHVENYMQRNHYGHAGLFRGHANFMAMDWESLTHVVTDTIGDGIPDWWKTLYGVDPSSFSTASQDGDGDGLSLYSEYLIGANPWNRDNDGDGISDGDEDTDGDGLANVYEQNVSLTLPNVRDTDDDGAPDNAEVLSGTDPANSLRPLTNRVLRLDGSTNSYAELPAQTRFALTNFTLEAAVKPASTWATSGTVISREFNSSGYENFKLKLDASSRPVFSFMSFGTNLVALTGPQPLPLDQWSWLSARYDANARMLSLAVNGVVVQYASNVAAAVVNYRGSARTRIGSGFNGDLDEVRIWNAVRTTFSSNPLTGSENNLVAYYRMDDGTSLAINSTNRGQVQDFAMWDWVTNAGSTNITQRWPNHDWTNRWLNGATLYGNVQFASGPWMAVDSDNDGMPDWWEVANGLDPTVNDAASDLDGDGISNLNEYRIGTNPRLVDSDGDGVSDALEDADGDGLSNIFEQSTSFSRLDRKDTDDDGLEDGYEVNAVGGKATSPVRSLDPMIFRALSLNGTNAVVIPPQDRHHLASWTVQSWVWPSNNANGVVVSRRITNSVDHYTAVNYELGVTNTANGLRAYVRYSGVSATNPATVVEVRVDGTGSREILSGQQLATIIPAQSWTHLAGTYDATKRILSLYVNGELATYRDDAFEPAGWSVVPPLNMAGALAVGAVLTPTNASAAVNTTNYAVGPFQGILSEGFEGYLDEVQIQGGAASAASIRDEANGVSPLASAFRGTATAPVVSTVRQLPLSQATNFAHKAGELLVRFKPGLSVSEITNKMSGFGVTKVRSHTLVPVHLVRIADGTTVRDKLSLLRQDSSVLYAEPNYRLDKTATPNDPMYSQLYAMHNTGQGTGKSDADIDAPEAWDKNTGNGSVIVAVIDTGVDYTHPDLVANMWVNPGETAGDLIDNDGNGYVDDIHGWDFSWAATTNLVQDPMDTYGHGTHCAGTIGAVGNNGIGVVGVNWNVKIMAVKFMESGFGFTDDAIACLEYAWQNGARISNNSWGGGGYSQGLYDAIAVAGSAGHLFVAAAGNSGMDNDISPHYPSSYDLDNIVAVAATDRSDALASFSNYGKLSVDLAAPGVSILSTMAGGGYASMDGTSMASPHVAGAAALLLANNPALGYQSLKRMLMAGVDAIPAVAESTVTGGRLNVNNALISFGALALYLNFDDSGLTAEDFSMASDWDVDWVHAGRFTAPNMLTTNVFVRSDADSDEDGMPDWWEELYGLDPLSSNGEDGATGDADGDGLSNLNEYYARLNPYLADTDRDGTSDLNEDSDGDGLSNGQEQAAGTQPGLVDTDDDGVQDGTEISGRSDPLDGNSPENRRAVTLAGNGRLRVRTAEPTDAATNWTVEAFVKPAASNVTGIVLRRAEQTSGAGARWTHYELGLSNGVPYVQYAFRSGTNPVVQTVSAPYAIGTNWTHLAAVQDLSAHMLRLYVDGKRVAYLYPAQRPPLSAVGGFETLIGGGDLISSNNVRSGFQGQLDAVRVWSYIRSGTEIQNNREILLPEFVGHTPDANRSPQYLFNFDDGGQYAQNSRYTNDWAHLWSHAAVAEGGLAAGSLVAATFPPANLDQDDDTLSDATERSKNWEYMRSESPYVQKYLNFDGTGRVFVDELVDDEETARYATTNFTLEAWVRPYQATTGMVSLISRRAKSGDFVNYELGLINTSGTVRAYVRYQREQDAHDFFTVTGGSALPVGTGSNAWTHLAAVYSNRTMVLFVNGVEALRSSDQLSSPYVVRPGYVQLGSSNYVGDLKEVRIWKTARSVAQLTAEWKNPLAFSGSMLENVYDATTDNAAFLGRNTTNSEDGLIYDYSYLASYEGLLYTAGRQTHKFTMETWVKMNPGAVGGTLIERKVDVLLLPNEPDWRTINALNIDANGRPQAEWWGQVEIVTPIYEDVGDPPVRQLVRLEYAVERVERSLTSEVDIRDGTWHHVAAVGDGRTVKVYIDGKLDVESISYYVFRLRAAPSFESLFWTYAPIGSVLRIADDGIQAQMDEALVWNEDQSGEEVQKHMRYGLTPSDIRDGTRAIDPLPDFAYDDGEVHQDLISYVHFDGQITPPYVPDVVNSSIPFRMLPTPSGSEILADTRPPVVVDRLRSFHQELAAYFGADDGGATVEQYMERNDYGFAGQLLGGVRFALLGDGGPLNNDVDNDGLPDSWESLHGFDVGTGVGDNGPWGDPDGDGLNNRAEYLAGTDPRDADSNGDGVGDFDSTYTNGATFGQMYTDSDGMDDAWEANYSGSLSPLVNDAKADPDGDGWDNLSEFLAGSSPDQFSSYPSATLNVRVRYLGTNVAGVLRIDGYRSASMDGIPMARGVLGGGLVRRNDDLAAISVGASSIAGTLTGGSIIQRSVDFRLRSSSGYQIATLRDNGTGILTGEDIYGLQIDGTIDYATGAWTINREYTGYSAIIGATWTIQGGGVTFPSTQSATIQEGFLRQGDAWFFAYIDNNANGTFDVGEPAGLVDDQPVKIRGDGIMEVGLGLSDSVMGFQRMSWTPSASVATVTVTRSTSAGTPVVFIRSNLQHRAFLHEGDYFNSADVAFGLPPGDTFGPGYRSFVRGGTSLVPSNFSYNWAASLAAPKAMTPAAGSALVYARNTLSWTQDYRTTYTVLEIRKGSAVGPQVYVKQLHVPFIESDGTHKVDIPFYAGDGDTTNGIYFWRLACGNPVVMSSASEFQSFYLSLQDAPVGAYTIEGQLSYFGKANNGNFVIQAFNTSGFNGVPEAQISLGTNRGSFKLRGLRAGTYYVRGFLDQNGNKRLDATESFGVINSGGRFYPSALPKSLTVPSNIQGEALVVRWQDTDNDRIPDDWEVSQWGNITSAGFAGSYSDLDRDGLDDFLEYLLGTDPLRADTDGDGFSDGLEYHTMHTDPTRNNYSGGSTNLMPVAYGQTNLVTQEDAPLAITLSGFDAESAITYSIVNQPGHGTLSGTGANRTYTPAANFHGLDGFSFRVFDGQVYSPAAAVTITIAPVNDAPVAVGDYYRGRFMTGFTNQVTVNDTDVDNPVSSLAVQVTRFPTNGTLTLLTEGRFVYRSTNLSAKTDSFAYTLSDGSLTSAVAPVLLSQQLSVPSDYNGDGISDLAYFTPSTGRWNIRTVAGTILATNVAWGWPTARPVLGDYDGNGAADLAVFDTQGGFWYVRDLAGAILVWQNNWGWSTAKPVPGDYNGDGVWDQAVFDTQGGFWYIKSLNNQVLHWQKAWGWSTAKPVPGDYNGDGTWDQAVFDTQGGFWYIKTLNDVSLAWQNAWGWSTAKPVPGDYNGDGVWDQAVFDTQGGFWYIKTLSGTIISWKEPWGWSTAKPVSGDYDGDGIYDLAVYDRVTGNWYIKRVDGSIIAWGIKWGGAGMDVPALGD